MDKKNIISSSNSASHKLTRRAGVLKVKASKLAITAKEKEGVRKKLVVTAKKLAMTAKEKETVRKKLAVIAKKLAITAKEKEAIRNKLVVTAEQLAVTAKEKEAVRKKLEVTAENLSLKAKQLALIAEEKEIVKRKLVVTAKEKEGVRKKLEVIASKLAITAKEKEDIRNKLVVTAEQLAMTAKEKEGVRKKLAVIASKLATTAKEKEIVRNKLAVTAKSLAMTAKEKEDVRKKLEVTAVKLNFKAKQLVVTAKEKETVREKLAVIASKLAITAKEKEIVRNKLAVTAKSLAMTAKEKEDVRKKLAVTAEELKLKAKQLVVTAKEKKEKEDARHKLEVTTEKLKLKAEHLAVTVKEKENVQRKLIEHTKELEQTRLAILNILEDLRVEKQSLAKAKVKDEAVLESIGEGVIATDKAGIIILINRVAETLLGYKSQELLGRKLADAINLEDEKGNKVLAEERPIKSALGKNRTISTIITYLFKRKDGTKLPVALTVAPIILNKDIIGAVEVFRDITKEKEIDQAKSEFVSIASHQLRTPLTGIHWLTELLQKEKLTDQGQEFLNDIQKSVRRLNALVELLLNISRIEEGKIKILPQSINVVSLIKKIVDSFAILYSKKKLSLTFIANEKKMISLTDVGALQNIVQSILSNAIEYTPEGGKIEVKLQKHDPNFLLIVSDTGIGIPPKDQKRIFQKFSRASNAERVKPGGMGMGLWITKQATELLGGRIWFKSPSSTSAKAKAGGEGNKGTTFFIELPLKSKLIKGTKKFV